jgi:hypothetical protein
MDDELENLNREQLARRLANLVRIGVVEDADTIAWRPRYVCELALC